MMLYNILDSNEEKTTTTILDDCGNTDHRGQSGNNKSDWIYDRAIDTVLPFDNKIEQKTIWELEACLVF